MRAAAGLFAKFGAVIRQMPGPVLGGMSIVLFGMIAAIGICLLGENKVDLSENRNLFIVSMPLVVGLGISGTIPGTSVRITGLAIAALLGGIPNKVLPEKTRAPLRRPGRNPRRNKIRKKKSGGLHELGRRKPSRIGTEMRLCAPGFCSIMSTLQEVRE